MPRYLLSDNKSWDSDSEEWPGRLQAAYRQRERPGCLCRGASAPVAMYLAKHGDSVLVKRMPNSGAEHAPECEHHEIPKVLSGRGEVDGSAIREDEKTGETTLKLDFALKKMPGRAPAAPSGAESDEVENPSAKLGLRAFVHYLWEEAGLNRWHPRFQGRRSWGVVYRALMQAVAGKNAKAQALADVLHVPEPFALEDKERIEGHMKRRIATLGRAGGTAMGVALGEVKGFEPSRYGFRLQVKHWPFLAFYMKEETYKKITEKFADQFALTEALEGAHLVAALTFSVSTTGIANLEKATLLAMDAHWLPIESMEDADLVAQLVGGGRVFHKGLRYNGKRGALLANAVLQDSRPPAALFIAPADADDGEWKENAEKLAAKSGLASWCWHPGEEDQPPLPAAGEATPRG